MTRYAIVAILVVTFVPYCGYGRPLSVNTSYETKRDVFITIGHVTMPCGLEPLTELAARFESYRDWALRGINKKASGKAFIIKLLDVAHRPGTPGPQGHFAITFDVDLSWPFRERGSTIKFGVDRVRRYKQNGIDRMSVSLFGVNRLIKRFELELAADGDQVSSRLAFKAVVKLHPVVDTFFPIGVYRKNIEYRIAKVVLNLRDQLARTMTKDSVK